MFINKNYNLFYVTVAQIGYHSLKGTAKEGTFNHQTIHKIKNGDAITLKTTEMDSHPTPVSPDKPKTSDNDTECNSEDASSVMTSAKNEADRIIGM